MASEEAKSKQKERQREYYLKHRDKMLAYSRKYIKDHPEKQKLYRENAAKKRANGIGYYQRYYQRNKENRNGGKALQASKGLERTGRKRDVQPKERSTSPEWTDRLSRLQRHDADTISERLEGMHQSWGEKSQRQCLWRDLARHCEEGNWRQFPTQSPVCRGNDGIPFDVDSLTISFPKWRQESIKAYGNAWVPQVAYEIFRAIEAEENK